MKTLEPNVAPVEKKPELNAHSERHDEETPTHRPKLGWWALLVVVLVIVGVVAGLVPRLRHREQLAKDTLEMGVPTVEVTSAVRGKATAALTLPAEVKPVVEAPIYARASGFIKKWYVDIGAQVKAGEVLADIDTPELNQELEAARAALVRAEADLALARTTSERWTELLKTSSVSEQEAAEKQADLKLKAATVDASKANMQRLTDLQSFAHVTAPFAGTVTSRSIDVGDLINATSGRELFRLADVHTLRVFVRVPQSATPNIEKGLQAVMMVPEWPAKKFQARVVRTSGAIDANSRTLLVELEVDNTNDEVLAGSYAQVAFNDIKQDPALVLPSNTLIFRSDGPQVGVVKPDGKVELRNIVLGRDYGRSLEILSGISVTDKVIVNPSDSLTSGATVRLPETKLADTNK
ncbi:efflux RND transporter periplasmic adaptor subunit [Pedosphaera parvula]|uniref:Efflux transporter, RND family, MFP subunit n=1 Tax=Pedosphaera parvula (strain Ellin514) TaxID=320771 RepID=B9XBA9_PEDPL|nr:efflux RND transporter periplasmic adaptor subunit [Pedosphaera parvula]EEF62794.1 efflux transporter, RND family, MFP subunit [Pedosphaera parvula Ellin514]